MRRIQRSRDNYCDAALYKLVLGGTTDTAPWYRPSLLDWQWHWYWHWPEVEMIIGNGKFRVLSSNIVFYNSSC